MERRGQLHLLRAGGTLAWAAYSPARFLEAFGISEDEWAACDAAWPASERAQRFGLAGKQRQRGLNVDCGLVASRSREMNARRSKAAGAQRGAGGAS